MAIPAQSYTLKRRLLVVAAAVFAGWLFEFPAWGLALGLVAVVIWDGWHIGRLVYWLNHADDQDPPEAQGLWGELFDGIYQREKHHHNAEARLKGIINRVQESTAALRDAVVMVDSQGNIEWWNRASKRLLGFKRPDDQGQPIVNLIRDPRFVRYFARRRYADPLELASPIDRRLTLQFTVTEFGRNDRLLLVRDVSRLKRLEQMRQDFVANASHELRTPLTVIRGYLETILDHAEEPRWQRPLSQMLRQAQRMDNLVTDLLLLSRLETTDSPIEELPVDLIRLMKEIQEQARLLDPEKEQEVLLEIRDHFTLLGEEKELHSAISNLAFNAVKYTQPKGQIRLEMWMDDQGGHVAVSDNGPGIDAQHLPRLTERFYRVDEARSSSTGGTGLGLAIVKHVLLRHGGSLEVSSQPDQGSRFICHFPASLVRRENSEDSESSEAG